MKKSSSIRSAIFAPIITTSTLLLAASGQNARAGIIFRFSDDGTDTTVEVSGSLNLTGLTATSDTRSQILNVGSNFLDAWWGPGAGAISNSRYGISGTSSGDIGSVHVSNPAFIPDLSPLFGVTAFTDSIFVPSTYVSGTAVSYTGTLTGETLSSLGFSPNATQTNTYVVDGGTDSVSFTTTAIPEPSGVVSLGALLSLGFLLNRRR